MGVIPSGESYWNTGRMEGWKEIIIHFILPLFHLNSARRTKKLSQF